LLPQPQPFFALQLDSNRVKINNADKV